MTIPTANIDEKYNIHTHTHTTSAYFSASPLHIWINMISARRLAQQGRPLNCYEDGMECIIMCCFPCDLAWFERWPWSRWFPQSFTTCSHRRDEREKKGGASAILDWICEFGSRLAHNPIIVAICHRFCSSCWIFVVPLVHHSTSIFVVPWVPWPYLVLYYINRCCCYSGRPCLQ